MFAVLLPLIPLTVLLSTKGLMFMLLSAYGGAMWTFLSGAPRVYTIMVPNLDDAKRFYEQYLKLPEAELPLHYYYGYEQTVGSFDPMYYQGDMASAYNYNRPLGSRAVADDPGLWYQLTENAQVHIITGSADTTGSYANRRRHVSFDRDGIKALQQYIAKQKIPHTVRSEKPMSLLVRDRDGQAIELAEIDD
ncbi:hypothetical protein [Synechococcus sp. PCC 7336]|uniref:hypothetical protein n=1 Tax=Synechococcus sp. PCC 7336 TaxID=195250 RepID=UPI000349B247|nr:hypothetical protein [Synechococcus sp. PCC 7336]